MKLFTHKIIRSSILISGFTLLTRAVNYLTILILARVFGTGKEMDAFFSAMTIPQIILAILTPALTATVVPLFIQRRSEEEMDAWKIASISFNLLFVILAAITVLGNIFSGEIIALINPGFTEEILILSTSLFRFFLLAAFFSGVSVILTNLYFAHHSFFKPLLFQFLNSVVIFSFVIAFHSNFGIKSIAGGAIAGALCQFFLLAPILMNRKKFFFSFDFKKKEIMKLGRLLSPLIIGALFYKTNVLIERYFASRMGEGIISYLGYALQIISTLSLVITQGVSVALFPRMSEYAAKKDYKELIAINSKGIRALLILIIPAVAFVLVARYDLVRIIFERGNFSPQDTQAVASALVAYLGFFCTAVFHPVVRVLYSLQLTLVVATVGFFSFIFYVVLVFFLSSYFSYIGIALAVSVQYVTALIVLSFIFKRKVGDFDSKVVFICAFKAIVAASVACLVVFVLHGWLGDFAGYPFNLLVGGALGVCLYTLVLVVLKTEELSYIFARS